MPVNAHSTVRNDDLDKSFKQTPRSPAIPSLTTHTLNATSALESLQAELKSRLDMGGQGDADKLSQTVSDSQTLHEEGRRTLLNQRDMFEALKAQFKGSATDNEF